MVRSIRFDAVLVQAVIAGALSFAHLQEVAAAAGQTGWKAWAYPISVDLLLVAAWRRLRHGGPARLAWCWFVIALVASLGANVATAGFLDLQHPPAWLRFGVAGWPALAFLGGTLLAHSAHDREAAVPAEPAPAPDLESDAEPRRVTDPVPTPETAPAAVDSGDPIPALPVAEPIAVPAALVTHARKVADDHHARTGNQIDTDTLRARLGVPAPMADAIAVQLA
ncbi:DUF2637 domain-containing protein [Streptomyces luteolus]|uniref:DUF2637 domain-containing protein n=1 Tax=Streptomyces luteolus TaxID=3043615 RepID=A0ABT6SSI2_9ACTN|nr:DUF2637 domain-containing protein [Streptomyces sp. B-S-A12]MDI3418566.1 DUF2637 domain-containing protein [Streptomyces sp. B-S-A12]